MSDSTTAHIQRCLDRLGQGDVAARDDLVKAACTRLTRLTRKMFRSENRLRRWEETSDIVQTALLRLLRRLERVTPASPRQFFRLAAREIRCTLIDLARRYYGPLGLAVHQEIRSEDGEIEHSLEQEPIAESEPDELAVWAEFHQWVETLPEDEREVFDIVWYQGLSYVEAAQLLEVSTRTVMRRWHAVCLKLQDSLG